MPVTTRRQSRGTAQPNAMEEDERIHSLSANLREVDGDDDDPMDGPLGALSSSEVDDDVEDDSGDEHLSSLSEGEESDSSEFGKGMLHSSLRLRDLLSVCASTNASNTRSKAPKGGENFTFETQEGWS